MPGYGNRGRAILVNGTTFVTIWDLNGDQLEEDFGYAVAGMGDLNADGYAEYATGAPFYNDEKNSQPDVGEIRVYDGSTGTELWVVRGPGAYEYYGSSFASIADLDGDGGSELLVGVPQVDEARIYDSLGNLIHTISGYAGSKFGEAVARIGDVDGDGSDDFLVAAPLWDGFSGAKPDVGRVNVYSGDAAVTYLGYIVGADDGDAIGYNGWTGTTLAGIGDLDRDGVSDFLVGAPYSDTNGSNAGLVRAVSGASLATIHTIYGDVAQFRLGFAVASIGDFNHDGVDDYAAGAPNATSAYGEGVVRVFSGLDGSTLWTFEDDGNEDSSGTPVDFGFAVGGGDFNGDGNGDVFIGDPYWVYPNGAFAPGTVVLYHGCPAWWENYGAGWPDKLGVPDLVALDEPAVGEPIDIVLDNSLGGLTLGLLLIGFSDASIPTSAGGTILVDQPLISPVAIPAGGLTLSDTLPDDPALYFFEVFLQALEADPFASKNISFTPGLKLHLGFDLT
jgi:hypothetical protein